MAKPTFYEIILYDVESFTKQDDTGARTSVKRCAVETMDPDLALLSARIDELYSSPFGPDFCKYQDVDVIPSDRPAGDVSLVAERVQGWTGHP